MTAIDRIEERLAAIERTIADESRDLTVCEGDSTGEADLERVESRLDTLDERVAELESTVQGIDGYVSRVESVNRDVERRADSAMATVDRLERRLETIENTARNATAGREERQPATVSGRASTGAGHEHDDTPSTTDSGDQPQSNPGIDTTESASANSKTAGRRFVERIRNGVATVRERFT